MLGTATANFVGVISKSRCCDLGNFLRTHLSGKRLFGPTQGKAGLGLLPVFQRPELKLGASLALYWRTRQLILAQPAKDSPSGLLSFNPSQHDDS